MSNKELVKRLKQKFDDYANMVDGMEVWFARDLQRLLGYEKWQMFQGVIERAKNACQNLGHNPGDHFIETDKPIEVGKGAKRVVKDFLLTRFAGYLVANNGDTRKKEASFAQGYFLSQTRKHEILEQRFEEFERMVAREKLTDHEAELGRLAFERGVDGAGLSRIRSKGDRAMFTYSTSAMKRKLGVPRNRPLADFLPRVTTAGKAFATEITTFNIENKDLQGENPITREHIENNEEVRDLLLRRGIVPEELPPAEDIKKVERRVKKDERNLPDSE